MKLTQLKLYLLVWSVPIVRLARLFQVSDVTLKKRCKKFNVPTPGRGYWRQIERGRRPVRRGLEQFDDDFELPVEFRGDLTIVAGLIAKAQAEIARIDEPAPDTCTPDAAIEKPAHSGEFQKSNSRTLAESEAKEIHGALTASVQSLDPVLPVLLELAERHNQVTNIRRLLASLEGCLQQCDFLTAAAVSLWMERARAEAQAIDPVAEILRFGQTLATGERNSPWWVKAP